VALMNPFERHGIRHLSPSSINCFADQASFWVISYLMGYRDKGSAAMWRGSAVEAGVDHYLRFQDLEGAVAAAMVRFELDANFSEEESVAKERVLVRPMVEQACAAFEGLPLPDARQLEIEYWIDGIEVPIKGFVDYLWPKRGRELKTTKALPSSISPAHARQAAIYQAAKQKPFEVTYVTPKKFAVYRLGDGEEALKSFEQHAKAIRKLLSISTDKHEIAGIFVPDFKHYRWSNEAARTAAQSVWQ
jgi:hypothetical protein